MAETRVQEYYHFNMPRKEYVTDYEYWDDSASLTPTLTIAPSSDEALFVDSIKFLVSDDFAMTDTEEIEITIVAYDGTPQVISILATAVAPDALSNLIALGNPECYKEVNIDSNLYHHVVFKFKSPVYLRSSTTPTESITVAYVGAGGITAGTMRIAYDAWKIAEEDSGV